MRVSADARRSPPPRRWVALKTGEAGDDACFWYLTGELFSYPGGELLARCEGLDTTRVLRESPTVVSQLSRKLFLFKDKESGVVLTSFGGQPVAPVQYPYQLVRYELDGETLKTEVTQGSGEHLVRLSGDNISVRHLSGTPTVAYSVPVFLNLETEGGGAYQAYENYDYFVSEQTGGGGGAPSHHVSWIRFGNTQPFTAQGVMHITGWRLKRFADVPEALRTYIEAKAPMWADAPADLEEVARLQRASS